MTPKQNAFIPAPAIPSYNASTLLKNGFASNR